MPFLCFLFLKTNLLKNLFPILCILLIADSWCNCMFLRPLNIDRWIQRFEQVQAFWQDYRSCVFLYQRGTQCLVFSFSEVSWNWYSVPRSIDLLWVGEYSITSFSFITWNIFIYKEMFLHMYDLVNQW